MPGFVQNRRGHFLVFCVCLGAVLAINAFSATTFHTFSAVVELKMHVGYRGETRLVVPPIGEIKAETHLLPIRLTLELRSVNLSSLRTLVFAGSQGMESFSLQVEQEIRQLIALFFVKLLGLGFLGALLSLVLLGIQDRKTLLWAGVAGVSLILVLVFVLGWTYDFGAFKNLEYAGIIEVAPWVLDVVWQSWQQVESLGERVQVLAKNLYSALQRLEELPPLGLLKADLLAVHVSDIHNNPVAYDFLRQVIESFPVDLILDTGDLTDWGTSLEAEITKRIAELDLPYVFVSGNHESREVLDRLASLENVVLIDQQIVSVQDLQIAGAGDLVALQALPTPAFIDELATQAREINSWWSRAEDRPIIFMVHNHRVAKAIEPGLFPVVLYGHTHTPEILQINGTVYNNAGTTGAAGIRGFQQKEPLPYSLALLYFVINAQGVPTLQVVDGIHVTGLGQGYSLQRTFVELGRNTESNVEMLP